MKQYWNNSSVWTHKALIEQLAKDVGFLGDNAGRQLRLLVEERKIDKRKSGKSLEYRYVPDIDEYLGRKLST